MNRLRRVAEFGLVCLIGFVAGVLLVAWAAAACLVGLVIVCVAACVAPCVR